MPVNSPQACVTTLMAIGVGSSHFHGVSPSNKQVWPLAAKSNRTSMHGMRWGSCQLK